MLLALLLLAAPGDPLVFHGNVAMVEDVYRAVLDLPAGTQATPANARLVATGLLRFLRKSGYKLATVRARVQGEQIAVDIDEGLLDKTIFIGGGAFETLRLRLDLHLQNDVFNQFELERQLRAIGRRLGLSGFAYEIVPVTNASGPGLKLQDLQPLEELSLGLLRPGRPYELHILIQPGVFRPGISPELEINSLEGGAIGATYNGGRFLFDADRFDLGGRVAGAVRQGLAPGAGSSFVFTRALAEGAFATAPLWGLVRPSIRGRADLSDRQRPDLNLDSFKFFTLEAGVQLLVWPLPHLHASLGAGVERRLLFNVQPVGPPPMEIPLIAQSRPFAAASLEVTFDPAVVRRDHHHQAFFEGRLYGAPHDGTSAALHLFAHYQKLFALGWNEIWLEARAVSRTGFVIFPEEVSIGGDALRGPFGAEYTRRLAALDLEFRYSLLRDLFKLGVFHNLVAYGRIDRGTLAETLSLADSFGLGVHALIIDEFQLDAYFGTGLATGGRSDRGASLNIHQAY
jgi:hypothetical protein